jgi:hypothetical protein
MAGPLPSPPIFVFWFAGLRVDHVPPRLLRPAPGGFEEKPHEHRHPPYPILPIPGEDPHAARYWADLESALMAQAIGTASDLPPERRKALLRLWAFGTFNASAAGLAQGFSGCSILEWAEDNAGGHHLFYRALYGLTCPLAKIYRQPNHTWAALIVAGVRDDLHEAMAQAEWAVSRLTA